jgi:SNF2 family DNA or RNA helicase
VTDLPPLRPYQEQAIDLAVSRGNLLMAMTMGSGKTRTAVETVERLASMQAVVSGSVFVLNSTKYQWEREIKQWAPGATVLVIDGDKAKRRKLYEEAYKYRYVILNYDVLVPDWEVIQDYLPIDYIICDEATYIKSFTAKRSKKIKAMGKHSQYRFALSGAPVENRPEELFSIMEFVDREVLGTFHKFDQTFINRDHWGKPKSYKNLKTLSTKLSDAMFRRSRADIAEYLPKIATIETPVPLDTWSQTLYAAIRADLIAVFDEAAAAGFGGGFDIAAHYGKKASDENNRFKGQIMSRVTAMRLLCDHPQLLIDSAARFDDESTAGGSAYVSLLKDQGFLDKVPTKSAKLTALIERTKDALAEDPTNKVVIFSGFKTMLPYIERALQAEGIGSVTISGDVKSDVRDERIVRFNTDKSLRVFLSSDAGAYGVNLNAGSHLISYDLPWSGGSFAQRTARIDRISSMHDSITVESMFTKGTVEERQVDALKQKTAIAGAFLDGKFDTSGKNEGGFLTLDLSSMKNFLVGSN